MALSLQRPTVEMEAEYRRFAGEWEAAGEKITPASARVGERPYIRWLEEMESNVFQTPDGPVPSHTFFLVDESGIIFGAISIRLELNGFLLRFGGQIGYGIRPSFRGRGYANRMLAMALPVARDLGLDRVLVTCDRGNPASANTILRNGGVLENEVRNGDEMTQRYWIEL